VFPELPTDCLGDEGVAIGGNVIDLHYELVWERDLSTHGGRVAK
jgi:hypothetical protein